MHYLIDAYNLLFGFSRKKTPLNAQRQELIQEINDAAAVLKLNVTLVFDGAQDHFSQAQRAHFDTIALVYTPSHQSADEYILQEVAHSFYPERLTVVTNDRALSNSCRLHRAQTLSLSAFLDRLYKKKKQGMHRVDSPPRSYHNQSSAFERYLKIFQERLSRFEEE